MARWITFSVNIAKTALATGLLLITSSCTTTAPSYLSVTPVNADKPVIALVLGGGGAKGFAHIGVIKVLEANGIKPDMIVGSSVGSFVGSLYASGMSANELEQLALTTDDSELTDFTLAHQGIIEGIKLKDFVNAQVGQRPIEALPIRFAAIATEKHSGEKTVFTQGNTGLAVQASSSVPNIFIAPRIPEKVGKKYVDGGVSSMVPVDSARQLGADIVIAVDIMSANNSHSDNEQIKKNQSLGQRTIWSLLEQGYPSQTANQSKYAQTLAEVNRADVVIHPAVAAISAIDTTRRAETIRAGEEAARNSLPAIADAIAQAIARPKQ